MVVVLSQEGIDYQWGFITCRWGVTGRSRGPRDEFFTGLFTDQIRRYGIFQHVRGLFSGERSRKSDVRHLLPEFIRFVRAEARLRLLQSRISARITLVLFCRFEVQACS